MTKRIIGMKIMSKTLPFIFIYKKKEYLNVFMDGN